MEAEDLKLIYRALVRVDNSVLHPIDGSVLRPDWTRSEQAALTLALDKLRAQILDKIGVGPGAPRCPKCNGLAGFLDIGPWNSTGL
jgi:hypothetical protein